MTAAFDCAPVLLVGFNRPERLMPALQPQSKSAMLPANHRKALVGQPFATGAALETGWRPRKDRE